MVETELVLAQNMKVVGNDVFIVACKISAQSEQRSLRKDRNTLTAIGVKSVDSFDSAPSRLHLFTLIRTQLAFSQNMKIVVLCLSFPTPLESPQSDFGSLSYYHLRIMRLTSPNVRFWFSNPEF